MALSARTWLAVTGAVAGLGSLLATVLLPPLDGDPDVAAVAEPVALLLLAFAVTRWAARPILVTPIVVIALAVMVLRYSETPALGAGGKALAVGLWGTAGASAALLGLALRGLERARQAAQQAAGYRRQLAVAAELHDYVAHDLSEVVARIQAARYLGEATDVLEPIERAGLRSLESLEATVRALHLDSVPTEAGRDLAALPELVARFNAVPGPRAVLVAPRRLQLTADVAALVYRTVTECLTNLRKHAPSATEVSITIAAGTTGVEVTVADDGSGPANSEPGSGLRMLAARAETLGGTLNAGPAERAGWQVRLVVP
ncbi:sensor histidine kinase [Kribbella sp. NPDC056345]|uniref:sensor histidine kinase n=1 Tax=Kribbella sp. NPDC056345 TaxID=3345789 RepID=UPI0035D567B3